MSDHVDPEEIKRQRTLGWPDFHPEDYCHRCGRRNIKAWTATEWRELTGSNAGILCPVCFTDHDPDAIWMLRRWQPPSADRVTLLATLLRNVTNLGDDAERVARCIINAGWDIHD